MCFLAAEGGESTHNPIIPIWQEIVVGAIAFAVLCFVLMKFVFPRMEQTFQARVDAIEGGIKRAEAAPGRGEPAARAVPRPARRGADRRRQDP